MALGGPHQNRLEGRFFQILANAGKWSHLGFPTPYDLSYYAEWANVSMYSPPWPWGDSGESEEASSAEEEGQSIYSRHAVRETLCHIVVLLRYHNRVTDERVGSVKQENASLEAP